MPNKSNRELLAIGECRLEELRLILSDAISEWKSEEVINNLKRKITLKADSILRILGPNKMNIKSDLFFQKKLEFKYVDEGDEENLKKLRAIEILEEYIKIAGFELRRYNEEGIVGKVNGIIKSPDSKHTLFNYHAATIQAYRIGHVLIKKVEWEKIIEAAPGNNNKEKARNLTQLLNLPLVKLFAHKYAYLTTYIYYWMNSGTLRTGKVLNLTNDRISPSFEKGFDYYGALRLMKPASKV